MAVRISPEALATAYKLGKGIKKHLSSAEGRKLLVLVGGLIIDVYNQLPASKRSKKFVKELVVPAVLRLEDELGWDMPNMSEEVEDRFLVWVVNTAVDLVFAGKPL
jgi:hypothetical protein